MRSFSFLGIAILLVVLFLIDLYTFKGLRELLRNASHQNFRKFIVLAYWLINSGLYFTWLYLFFKTKGQMVDISYKFVYTAFGIFLMFFLPKLIFIISLVINDISGFLVSLFKSKSESASGELINRGTFITYIGAILSTLSFFAIGWGMLIGRYRFKVHNKKLVSIIYPLHLMDLKSFRYPICMWEVFSKNSTKLKRVYKSLKTLNPI